LLRSHSHSARLPCTWLQKCTRDGCFRVVPSGSSTCS
jgi:hypothetical protein